MQKSFRSFALIAALALTTAPAALANQTGCDPHPWTKAMTPASVSTVVYTVLSLFGI